MKKMPKTIAATTALITTPVLAHSSHESAFAGIYHFLTESDHLAVMALGVTALIYAVTKVKKNQS